MLYMEKLKTSGLDYFDTKDSSTILFNPAKISKTQLEHFLFR